jgi:hypothetical protein
VGYFCSFQETVKVCKQSPNGRKIAQSGHPAQENRLSFKGFAGFHLKHSEKPITFFRKLFFLHSD